MKKSLQVIDSISEWSGKVFMWFLLFLTLILCFEVFMRYVLNNPTTYSYDLSTMMGVVIGAGGLAYTHLHDGHIRVDVLWRRLSPRGRALADIIGSIVFFWPLMALLVWASTKWVIYSYSVKEISQLSYMYPIVWPVRAVMLIGFFLIIPQDVVKFIRNIYMLRGRQLS
jgi:TRAP-type mannitol/chloroaromatic compound transport system permease small subunit